MPPLVYKAFQEAGRPPYETLTPTEAREYLPSGLASSPIPNRRELKSVQPLAIPSPAGTIPARIYTPSEAEAGRMAWRRAWCFFTAAAG